MKKADKLIELITEINHTSAEPEYIAIGVDLKIICHKKGSAIDSLFVIYKGHNIEEFLSQAEQMKIYNHVVNSIDLAEDKKAEKDSAQVVFDSL